MIRLLNAVQNLLREAKTKNSRVLVYNLTELDLYVPAKDINTKKIAYKFRKGWQWLSLVETTYVNAFIA
jgi:hypothetical protein